MTRALFFVTLVLAAALCYAGLRQSTSFALREERPRMYWPRGNGILVGSWLRGGYVTHAGRSQWAGFRGGGPGSGK